jgi:hypothetical protein
LVFEVLAGGEAVKLGFAMKKYNTKVGSKFVLLGKKGKAGVMRH